ncbi:MAG: hypothetical protein K6T81_00125 [Alicyclobacillus macrosporangiidus]|uniref:hypothetical protein n=1 Tax=Alicyclobacillus macrosporangiidus TaxID=392015 RepID=UPI0026EC35AA|nr:hypothetical protein [Alicyclobacillus macrosporangiidus]MCL6597128.1 hypothetical protein [Alicyclobacillus macrosporangiidus]
MLHIRGVPVREIGGLPYAVHQVGDHAWQIVIENCARHPAGYTFAPVYGSKEEAMAALEAWPDASARFHAYAGDDTGASWLVCNEDS